MELWAYVESEFEIRGRGRSFHIFLALPTTNGFAKVLLECKTKLDNADRASVRHATRRVKKRFLNKTGEGNLAGFAFTY